MTWGYGLLARSSQPHPRLASSTAPQLSYVVTNHNTGAYCYHRAMQIALRAQPPQPDGRQVLAYEFRQAKAG